MCNARLPADYTDGHRCDSDWTAEVFVLVSNSDFSVKSYPAIGTRMQIIVDPCIPEERFCPARGIWQKGDDFQTTELTEVEEVFEPQMTQISLIV